MASHKTNLEKTADDYPNLNILRQDWEKTPAYRKAKINLLDINDTIFWKSETHRFIYTWAREMLFPPIIILEGHNPVRNRTKCNN